MISPEIRQLFAIVCGTANVQSTRNVQIQKRFERKRTGAKFHGPSSPQLHNEYKIGRPVAFSALDMLAYRSNEIFGVPERPSLKQLSYSTYN